MTRQILCLVTAIVYSQTKDDGLLLPLSFPSQLNSLRPNLSAAGSNQTRSLSGGFNLPSWQTVGQSDDVTTVTILKYELPKSNLNHSKYMRYN